MMKFDYLLDDDALLVVNKPAGIASVHDPNRDEPDLTTLLAAVHGDLFPVHRLDRDTSGVLVFARDAQTHRDLSAQFETRQIDKVYHAIVRGSPTWETRTIDAPLTPNGDRRHRTVVDPEDGKPSVTHFRVLEQVKGFALVEARPETGRIHQIRVHLAVAGHPVAVDTLYGDGKPILLSAHKRDYRPSGGHDERPLLGRLGLHALSLGLKHPATGEPMVFEAAAPKDIGATIKQLGKL
jgi:RluA family pseudouridine synthase